LPIGVICHQIQLLILRREGAVVCPHIVHVSLIGTDNIRALCD
jgi:hypothetical protein